ncbi:MAG: CopG family transcriptional regulator [Luteolibacter sp.]
MFRHAIHDQARSRLPDNISASTATARMSSIVDEKTAAMLRTSTGNHGGRRTMNDPKYSCLRPKTSPNFRIAQDNGGYYFSPVKTISLKLSDRLLECLEAESRARGTTKSSLVRDCIEKALDTRPAGDKMNCYDLASDLAGSVKGLPRDLATNPNYMEGFGR